MLKNKSKVKLTVRPDDYHLQFIPKKFSDLSWANIRALMIAYIESLPAPDGTIPLMKEVCIREFNLIPQICGNIELAARRQMK